MLSASLGLGYLARSLAALVLDVIFGNYTLTYIYLVVSFIFFPVLSFLYPRFLFLITHLHISSVFFYLLFIINNHPRLASLILLPVPLSPPSMHSFDTICHLDLFFWRLYRHARPPLSITCLVHPLHLNIVYHSHPARASTAAAIGAD